jgi:hypothetical protein
MIKYFVNEEERVVVAVLENTKYDAYNKICKMMRDTDFCVVPKDKYMMHSAYRAVVKCDERDEFNEVIGKKYAKERVLAHYYEALDKRLDEFRASVLVMNGKVFETPEILENNA